jgi:ubiquinone/menaquinone biosynthesis C-methylase UbiE
MMGLMATLSAEWAPEADLSAVALPSLYDRFAGLYAEFRLHRFTDDRAEIQAALDLGQARTVAELGCGPGFYATAFATADPRLVVTGIDRAPAQIAIARQRAAALGLTNTRFATADAQRLAQPDGTFDRVLTSRLLMVVADPAATIAEARRVLAPGGILLLAEPERPQTGILSLLRQAAETVGERVTFIEPQVERHFSAGAFRTLVMSQVWESVAIWEANGYRYARCRTDANADGVVGRAYS